MGKIIHLLVVVAALLVSKAGAEPIQITVDTSKPLCTNFLGFGVNWSPYPWFDISDAAWQRVFDRLDFMRVPMVRTMTRAYNYCEGFDANGNPIYAWDNDDMKKMYRLLDYCESRHVTVVIGEWDDPSATGDRSDIANDKLQPYHIGITDPRWTRIIGDFLDHLIKDKNYTCLKYYNLINEPNGSWSHCADFEKWRIGINNLHAELVKRGLDQKIQITGPDATIAKYFFWIDRAVLECPGILGAYDVHEYPKVADLEADHMEQILTGKQDFINRHDPNGRREPFFIGEMGMNGKTKIGPGGPPEVYESIQGTWMTDYSIQVARAGMAGGLAWDLDDAMHIVNNDKNWPDVHKTALKKWGFFNSLAEETGDPDDAKLRPWFFTWSLMSRSFPAGCQTLTTTNPGVLGIRTLAAKRGDDISLALVNDSDQPQELHVTVPGSKKVPQLQRYNYFPDDQLVDKNGYPLPKETLADADLQSGLNVSLPARSVVIFTSIK